MTAERSDGENALDGGTGPAREATRDPLMPDSDGVVRMTMEEARRLRAEGRSRTDRARLGTRSHEEIRAAIARDPDAAPEVGTDLWAETADGRGAP